MKQLLRNYLSDIVKHGFIPAFFYCFMFCLLTFPLIRDFSSHFFTDDGDGFMNIWNIWWINTAVGQPSVHPSIWHTDMLHWPFGTTLLGQTLNPFNGLDGRPAPSGSCQCAQAHNVIVLFSFVMSGLTAYWLSLLSDDHSGEAYSRGTSSLFHRITSHIITDT
jgi:hypothetical protein